MHPLAARTVRLALAGGAKLDLVEHFDDLAALDVAARETDALSAVDTADLLDRPVVVGDSQARSGKPAILYPLSYAAHAWVQDSAQAWFGADALFADLSVAWAMAHARDPQIFRETGADRKTARRAIAKWACDLACGMEALLATTVALLRKRRHTADAVKEDAGDGVPLAQCGALRMALARLEQEFGGTDDEWLFGPRERLDACLALLRRQDAAAQVAECRAGGKTIARDPDSPEVAAFRRWHAASEAFLKKVGGDSVSRNAASTGRKTRTTILPETMEPRMPSQPSQPATAVSAPAADSQTSDRNDESIA